jgi:hypothetical protein
MQVSLLKAELGAVKRMNEQHSLIKLLPKAETDGSIDNSELILDLQERLVRAEHDRE